MNENVRGPVVEMRGVKKRFGPLAVLEGLDLTVERGENIAILGQSGTGKSVLLKLIIGLLQADGGEVRVWGQEIGGLPDAALEPLRRRMGMVFQSGALFDSMTVGENLAFPLRELGGGRRSDKDIAEIVRERLEWVGLAGSEATLPSELSGGMRKRVALARTLTLDPELVLYDEPTTGLDPLTARKVSTLIRDLDRKLDSTSIVVTHDVACAATVASRWCYLARGRIIADGAPGDLLECDDEEVREYLADVSDAGYMVRRCAAGLEPPATGGAS